MAKHSIFQCVIFSSFIFTQSIYASEDSSLDSRVKSQLPAALLRMEEFYSRVKGNGIFTGKTVDSSTPRLRSGRFSFAVDGPYKKFSYLTEEIGRARTSCLSPDSAFVAVRKGATEPYALSNVGDRKYVEALLSARLDQYLYAPYSVAGVRLSEMMADPTFRTTSVTQVVVHEQKSIRLEYDYSNKKMGMGPGWVVICPALGWAVVSFEHKFINNKDPRYRMHGEIEYAEFHGSEPVPRKVEFSRQSGDNSDFNSYQFDVFKHEATPIQEFAPTYLGLPELGRPAQSRSGSRASYWFLGLAMGGSILAALLKYIANRIERKR
jgi:hypothetical protein